MRIDSGSHRIGTWTVVSVGLLAAVAMRMGEVQAEIESTIVTDPAGEEWSYGYSENLGVKNLVRKTSHTDGKSTVREYDERNNVILLKDAEEHAITYSYNEHKQRASMTLAAGTPSAFKTTYEYLSPDIDLPTVVKSPSVVHGLSRKVTTLYDGELNVVAVTISGYEPSGNPVTQTTQFQYNGSGQVTMIDGPRTDVEDVTRLTYYECDSGNQCGELASVTNPLGHTTTYDEYDANGRLVQRTDPSGVVTYYRYHPRGWLKSIRETALGGSSRATTYDYDGVGQLVRVTFPEGTKLAYTYDAAHNLRSVTDNVGNLVEYFYDLKGKRIRTDTRSPDRRLVRRHEQGYDARGYPTDVTHGRGNGEAGSFSQVIKDAVGNLVSEVDPNSNPSTIHRYDDLHRLTETLDSLSNSTFYGYDVRGNLSTVKAPNGATTEYEYDDLGNLLREVSPDRGEITRTFDGAGNVVMETDARGEIASFVYDALNRLISIDYSGAEEDVTLVYDKGDEPDSCRNGTGRLCVRKDAGGTSRYHYDPYGNVVEVTNDLLGQSYTIGYEYDDADRVVGIRYPSGRKVDIGRDPIGRIIHIVTMVNGETTEVLANREYRGDGMMVTQSLGNGLVENRSYDLRGRLGSQTFFDSRTRLYRYDPNGNLRTIDEPNGIRTYTYDTLDRLMVADTGSLSLAYEYDANGNRVLSEQDGVVTDYTYTPHSNRLESVGEKPIRLDAAGNTLRDHRVGRTFEYNKAGRLARVLRNGVEVARYTYDSRGLRVVKRTPTKTAVYHYDWNGMLLAETRTDGTTEREYLYADAQPLAVIENEIETVGPVKLTSPTEGSIIETTPVLFEWSRDQSKVARVRLTAGTTQGTKDIFDMEVTGRTSQNVDIPMNGDDVYVALSSLVAGEWSAREYVFGTARKGTEKVAVLETPSTGEKLNSTPVMFRWSVDETLAERVLLHLGTAAGRKDLFASEVTGTTEQAVYIPLNGNDVYVTLRSNIGGVWAARHYAFSTMKQRAPDTRSRILVAIRTALEKLPIPGIRNLGKWLVNQILPRARETDRDRNRIPGKNTRSLKRLEVPSSREHSRNRPYARAFKSRGRP